MPTPLNILFCNLPSFHKHCNNKKPFRASLTDYTPKLGYRLPKCGPLGPVRGCERTSCTPLVTGLRSLPLSCPDCAFKFMFNVLRFNYETDLIHNLTGSSRIIHVFNYTLMKRETGAVKTVHGSLKAGVEN